MRRNSDPFAPWNNGPEAYNPLAPWNNEEGEDCSGGRYNNLKAW